MFNKSAVTIVVVALIVIGGLSRFVMGEGSPPAVNADRLNYLYGVNPYYVSGAFAKLTTPQWLGEKGVDAVVVLAIDDLRPKDQKKYSDYLAPVIQAMQGLRPAGTMSIMACSVAPQIPELRQLRQQGVSIEVHTLDHPLPMLRRWDFDAAKSTYDRCIELVSKIPGNAPVAFRVPFCDTHNTPSPRFFAEIFGKTTRSGAFLSIDSSVFNLITEEDGALPRQITRGEDGRPRFGRYLPASSYANLVVNYPYPYVIGGFCWEFPPTVPSDYEAQLVNGPNSDATLGDMKFAIDAAVLKQGVYAPVFHPHGWIRNDQIAALVKYAAQRYPGRVRFMSFGDALQRLNENLLQGQAVRSARAGDNGVRIIDVDGDGFMDVIVANEKLRVTRIWRPTEQKWLEVPFPTQLVDNGVSTGAQFGIVRPGGAVSVMIRTQSEAGAWTFSDGKWSEDKALLNGLDINGHAVLTAAGGVDQGVRFRDINHGGICELIVGNCESNAVFQWDESAGRWRQLSFALPGGVGFVDGKGRDAGLRMVDLDGDGCLDVIFSDDNRYVAALFGSMTSGWSKTIADVRRAKGQKDVPMPFVRETTNNGAWFHGQRLLIQNEDTEKLPDFVELHSFAELLRGPSEAVRK
ncbi:MAG TPA: polysaccharide deacetylase family protein [Pirellulales bacterium]